MIVLHIEDRFHPSMGYQLNFFAKYHQPGTQFYIITSDSLNLWSSDHDTQKIKTEDRIFEEENRVSIIRLKAWLTSGARSRVWLRGLQKILREIKPDVLYVHGVESYSALRVILLRRRFKQCVICFDTHTLRNQFQTGIKFKLYLWILRGIVARKINKYRMKVFGTTPENVDILKKEYGIQTANVLYSPIGTDPGTYRFDLSWRKEMRHKYGFTEEDIVLAYTGKMNMKKQPHLILKALKIAEHQISVKLQVVFIGSLSETYKPYLHEITFTNKNIGLMILPAFPVNELYRIYSMADLAVFPLENTLSALDAQICRLPVIMEGDQTNVERLEKGGLLYKKGDLNDLSGKILDLINDASLRARLGSEGEAYIREKFSYEIITMKMEQDLGIRI